MIKIYSHENSAIIYHLKNVMESYEISCEVRNENLSKVVGHYAPFGTWIELWIRDDSQLDEAQKVLKDALSPEAEEVGESWKCPNCGEESESQFTECWNCGTSRL